MAKPMPGGRVPLSPAVKRSLAFVGLMFGLAGAVEWYMLGHPDEIAPISWAFWWMQENAAWLPATLAGVGGAFYSHFFWYVRKRDFWYPLTWRAALIVAVVPLSTMALLKAWGLLMFTGAFMGGALFAHRYWYRLEHFKDHLARFHPPEDHG